MPSGDMKLSFMNTYNTNSSPVPIPQNKLDCDKYEFNVFVKFLMISVKFTMLTFPIKTRMFKPVRSTKKLPKVNQYTT